MSDSTNRDNDSDSSDVTELDQSDLEPVSGGFCTTDGPGVWPMPFPPPLPTGPGGPRDPMVDPIHILPMPFPEE
jgi:hypothetical protein